MQEFLAENNVFSIGVYLAVVEIVVCGKRSANLWRFDQPVVNSKCRLLDNGDKFFRVINHFGVNILSIN